MSHHDDPQTPSSPGGGPVLTPDLQALIAEQVRLARLHGLAVNPERELCFERRVEPLTRELLMPAMRMKSYARVRKQANVDGNGIAPRLASPMAAPTITCSAMKA